VCGISSKGEVYPCIGAPVPSGNLNVLSFEEIWNHSPVLNKIRNLQSKDFVECQKCQYIEYCSRSSGSIYTNTKNYTGCDSSTLMQAKKRETFFSNGLR
jgi:radical SAM protein with 4Fe4S-binding SPASM domain